MAIAVAVGACGRLDFRPVMVAGPSDAPPPGFDSDLGFIVIETIAVPSDGSSVTSTSVLSSAGVYRVNASGTITCGGVGDQLGDAEYHDFTNPADNNDLNGLDYGISIDHPTVGDKVTRWGAYTTSHVYEIAFTGLDSTLSANLHDGDYADNVGTLTLRILEQL